MKTLIASALVAATAFAGTAQALTSPAVDSEAKYIVSGADFSGLSTAEVNAVNNIIHGDGSTGEKRAQIKAFLQ